MLYRYVSQFIFRSPRISHLVTTLINYLEVCVGGVGGGAGQMDQRLRALASFPEDSGLITSTLVVSHNHSRGSVALSWPL